jgi:hypothetical protein
VWLELVSLRTGIMMHAPTAGQFDLLRSRSDMPPCLRSTLPVAHLHRDSGTLAHLYTGSLVPLRLAHWHQVPLRRRSPLRRRWRGWQAPGPACQWGPAGVEGRLGPWASESDTPSGRARRPRAHASAIPRAPGHLACVMRHCSIAVACMMAPRAGPGAGGLRVGPVRGEPPGRGLASPGHTSGLVASGHSVARWAPQVRSVWPGSAVGHGGRCQAECQWAPPSRTPGPSQAPTRSLSSLSQFEVGPLRLSHSLGRPLGPPSRDPLPV